MRSIRSIPLIVLAILALGCTQLPKTNRDPSELGEWRAQYVKYNPNGRFNKYILRGEVTRGMNAMEVLASWGIPAYRLRVAENGAEYWTYYETDIHTEDVTTYAFAFEGGVVASWVEGAGQIRLDTLSPKDLAAMFSAGAGAMDTADRGAESSNPTLSGTR